MPVQSSAGSVQRTSRSMLPRRRMVRKPSCSGRQRTRGRRLGGAPACGMSNGRSRAAITRRQLQSAASERATSRCLASVPCPRPIARMRCITTVSSSIAADQQERCGERRRAVVDRVVVERNAAAADAERHQDGRQRAADEADADADADGRDHEVQDAERQHQQEVEHRGPGAAVDEHLLDALEDRHALGRIERTARHALSEQPLDQAAFGECEHAREADEQQEERDADDQEDAGPRTSRGP